MGYRVDLTDRARRDLRNIYDRIHAEDSIQAKDWFNGLEAMVYSLEQHPGRGAITRESSKHRHLLYGNKPHVYRIIYRIFERTKAVRVLHIRHGAMDEFIHKK
jgi:plasmid stabilization system protein ParE